MAALGTLMRHDVVEQREGNYGYTVDLMRHWVQRQAHEVSESLSEKWVQWGRRHIMRPLLLFWWGVSGPVRPDFVVQRADIRPFQTGSET